MMKPHYPPLVQNRKGLTFDPVTELTPKCLGCGLVERRGRDERGNTVDLNLIFGLCQECHVTLAREARETRTVFHSRRDDGHGRVVQAQSLFTAKGEQ